MEDVGNVNKCTKRDGGLGLGLDSFKGQKPYDAIATQKNKIEGKIETTKSERWRQKSTQQCETELG